MNYIARRRRGHVYGVFNDAAGNYADDALTMRMFHDDALTMRFVTQDA